MFAISFWKFICLFYEFNLYHLEINIKQFNLFLKSRLRFGRQILGFFKRTNEPQSWLSRFNLSHIYVFGKYCLIYITKKPKKYTITLIIRANKTPKNHPNHYIFWRLCTCGTSQILDYCVAKQRYIKNVVHRIT